MIIGNTAHLDLLPYLPAKIVAAITYVTNNINANTPPGLYEIDGENCFVMLSHSPTRAIEQAEPEFHHRYIDVQIILNGPEGMAVSTLPPHTALTNDQLQQNDIAFVATPKEERVITLFDNDFIVLYPNEVHKPLCHVDGQEQVVRKAVIKVALDSL